MKVTYFIGSATGGGAERVMCELATYMGEHGHQSEILTVTETGRSYQIGNQVVCKTIDTKLRIPIRSIRVIIKMLQLFRYVLMSKTEVYVVFLPETIKAIMFFKKFIKVPVIVSERNDPASYLPRVQREMLSAFEKADGVVFQTKSALGFYQGNMELVSRCAVIPNAVARDIPEMYLGKREKVIVSVGRFNKQKNFHLLINAFAGISKLYPDYQLKIYGDGELKAEYIRLAEKLGVSEKILFPGFVDGVARKIRGATIFVLTSDYEGMPNALMEAMSVGIPCVATDCEGGGARYLITDGINGLLVPKGDQVRLQESIIDIIESEPLQKKLGENARLIADDLSYQVIYKKWEEFIKKIYMERV